MTDSFADHILTGHSTFRRQLDLLRTPHQNFFTDHSLTDTSKFSVAEIGNWKRSAGCGFHCEHRACSDGARHVYFTNRSLTGRRSFAFGDQGGARHRASASAEFVVANFFPPIAL
jgi:hypothetical protein